MKEVILIRKEFTSTTSRGVLYVDDKQFIIIERAWLNNKSNQSCIPVGRYAVDYLPRSASGKYKKVWHIKAVPNRSGILIHKGNIFSHSKGCLLIGLRKGTIQGQLATLNSAGGLRKFNKIMNRQSFNLTIINGEI